MIKGQRQRQKVVEGCVAIAGYCRGVDASGADNGNLPRDDDECRMAPGKHSEIRQCDGRILKIGRGEGAVVGRQFKRVEIAAQHRSPRPAMSRNTGTISPSAVSIAMPRSMRDNSCLVRAWLSNHAFSAGSAAQATAMARTRCNVTSASGAHHVSISTSSHKVAGTISARARAMLSAIARRTPRNGSPPPRLLGAARSTSRRVMAPPDGAGQFGKIDTAFARQCANRRHRRDAIRSRRYRRLASRLSDVSRRPPFRYRRACPLRIRPAGRRL